jgi:Ni/Fe-hydrogenase 1 B-type cytochrome subunit
VKFYLFALRKPPGFVGHNPLAGMVYTIVFFLYGTMIATGLAMYSASARVDSPFRFFQFLVPLCGGLQSAHWIHHVVMWLILGFAVHHVYSAIYMSQVEANATVESIFSGYKFVPPEDVIYSGYRFVSREESLPDPLPRGGARRKVGPRHG